MAQEIETPEQVSVADGATASFPLSFTFAGREEIVVTVTLAAVTTVQVLGVDYLVPDADWLNSGGSVVFQSGHLPASGARVGRRRRTPVEQPQAFGDDGSFRPVANEDAFDKLTRVAQEHGARIDRGLEVPLGEPGLQLPALSARDGRLPFFDDGGLTTFSGSEVVVALDATGRAVGMPVVNLLTDLGVDLYDDGTWLEGQDPATNDDGVWG